MASAAMSMKLTSAIRRNSGAVRSMAWFTVKESLLDSRIFGVAASRKIICFSFQTKPPKDPLAGMMSFTLIVTNFTIAQTSSKFQRSSHQNRNRKNTKCPVLCRPLGFTQKRNYGYIVSKHVKNSNRSFDSIKIRDKSGAGLHAASIKKKGEIGEGDPLSNSALGIRGEERHSFRGFQEKCRRQSR